MRRDPSNQVVATARNVSKATDLKEVTIKNTGRVHVIALDVNDDASTAKFAAAVQKIFPNGVDVLINNAGVLPLPKAKLEETYVNHLHCFSLVWFGVEVPTLNVRLTN